MAGEFDAYIGIDWSGAKGPRLPGLQIALARPGHGAPNLVPPPEGRWWTRPMVFDWLSEQVRAKRVLAGFDFAFAYAFADEGAYFPGAGPQPKSVGPLWALVERVCADAPELYGAPFYTRTELPYHRHFLSPYGKGDLYRMRQRLTEVACADVTSPHPVMKCIGAANVGTGSLAGMRFLHHMTAAERDRIAVWPFEEIRGRSVLVEIFPRLYFKRAGVDPRAWREVGVLNRTLAHYGSRPLAKGWAPAREDEPDALISAAALRGLAGAPETWDALPKGRAVRRSEGWIFGIDWGS